MRRIVHKILRVLDGTPAEYQPTQKRNRGQSLVEMAFITPLIAILIAGVIEIGFYANNYLILLEVSRVGARQGAVLVGENSPLEWDNDASLIPPRYGSPNNVDPNQGAYATYNDIEELRDNSRNCSLIGSDNAINNTQGFYNIILCRMLESLDPLEIKSPYSDPTRSRYVGLTDEEKVDDIVISVFSIEMINNAPAVAADAPNTGDFDFVGHYASNAPATMGDTSIDEFSGAEREGYVPVVVGRYPTNANECNTFEKNGVDFVYNVERDPFDFIDTNDTGPERTINPPGTAPAGSSPRDFTLELGGFVVGQDDAGNDLYAFEPMSVSERQRGWVFTGYHQVDMDPVTGNMTPAGGGGSVPVTDAEFFCVGSDWDVYDVQELISNDQFQLTQAMVNASRSSGDIYFGYQCPEGYNGTTPAADCEEIDVRQFYAGQGLVLVEIYWQHDLLGLIPGYNALWSWLGDTTDIYVWSAFPVATAAPNMTFWPAWASLEDN